MKFFELIRNPVKFRLFLLGKLPSAYFSGVRVVEANEDYCTVVVPYKWFSTNPFKSTYFACLAMAAEMSTGVLALANIFETKPAVSMLVLDLKAEFLKKAIGKTYFTCKDGDIIKSAIDATKKNGEPQTVTAISVGKNEAGEEVAKFAITWTFKRKK